MLGKSRRRTLAVAKRRATREIVSCAQKACGDISSFVRFLPWIRTKSSNARSPSVHGTFSKLPQEQIPWPCSGYASLGLGLEKGGVGKEDDEDLSVWTELLLAEDDGMLDAFDWPWKGRGQVGGLEDAEAEGVVAAAAAATATTTGSVAATAQTRAKVMPQSPSGGSKGSRLLDLPKDFGAARTFLMTAVRD